MVRQGLVEIVAEIPAHAEPVSDQARQQMRDELLSTGLRDFRALADALADAVNTARVVVLGSETAIAAANAERQGFMHVSKVL